MFSHVTFQGNSPQPQASSSKSRRNFSPQAYTASQHDNDQLQPGQEWFLNGGATNYVPSDLSNICIQSNYKGKDKLVVGNDYSIPILHILVKQS